MLWLNYLIVLTIYKHNAWGYAVCGEVHALFLHGGWVLVTCSSGLFIYVGSFFWAPNALFALVNAREHIRTLGFYYAVHKLEISHFVLADGIMLNMGFTFNQLMLHFYLLCHFMYTGAESRVTGRFI